MSEHRGEDLCKLTVSTRQISLLGILYSVYNTSQCLYADLVDVPSLSGRTAPKTTERPHRLVEAGGTARRGAEARSPRRKPVTTKRTTSACSRLITASHDEAPVCRVRREPTRWVLLHGLTGSRADVGLIAVFHTTRLSLAIVNLKPLLPGRAYDPDPDSRAASCLTRRCAGPAPTRRVAHHGPER